MSRFIVITILLSCLHIMARGQTIVTLDDIDLSALPQPTQAKALRYWFDDEASDTQTINTLTGTYTLDVTQLLEGLHTLHYQVIDSEDHVSYVCSDLFMKVDNSASSSTAYSLRYWFDDETVCTESIISGGIRIIDASTLQDGLHTFHYQVVGSEGQVYYVASRLFMKTGSNIGTETLSAKKLLYWFDDETTIQQADISGGIQLLDASELTEGLHTLHYQVLCNNGQMMPAMSSLFMRMNFDAETAGAQSLRYWFDDDASTVRVTDIGNGSQVLDVSDLITGLHTLNYQLIDSNGKVCVPMTRFFFKNYDTVIAVGTNCVTKYQYWMSKNSQAIQTVVLTNTDNPYSLIALLPMQHEPIHSDNFHFEVTNGVPAIYARNNFHIRFYDAQGYFTDGEKPFVDYSLSQAVIPVGELQTTQTFSKVSENDIRWYSLTVEQGDTVAFKTSQACSIQLFAPSGEEVYNAMGSTSVSFGGCHTWESGTYYLAIHDVTGSKDQITLDYMHMDKYDVVNWDVHTVGNGGCSTITFKGNGFRDLYAVDLYTAEGDTIHSVDISHDSDAETAVTFDFSGAELGVYDAVFHFTQEDKHFVNIVTVEEAVDIELATNVSFPSSFLRGTSTTYTIKVTNLGNMTAYAVPLELRLQTTSMEDILEVHFDGNIKDSFMPIEILNDSLDEETISILHEEYDKLSDLDNFFFYHDSLNNKCYGLAYAILNIPPNKTEEFTISIKSTSGISLRTHITNEWSPLSFTNNTMSTRSMVKRKALKDWMCCYKDHIECFADISASIASKSLPPGANCLTSLGVTTLEVGYDLWCTEGNTAKEKFDNYIKDEGQSLAKKLSQYLISCVTGFLGEKLAKLRAERKQVLDDYMNNYAQNKAKLNQLNRDIFALERSLREAIANIGRGLVYGLISDNCILAFTIPKPNCPPNPGGGGGPSNPVPPSDPNDIYGYLSEAGSKFIPDTVARVNYTIEFENDTAFAQASAHTIVIRDTLDSRYFDLASFLPTSVKIGERETFLDETEDVKTTGGVTSFLKTIDMRPEINAIAQVEGEYSQQTGIAKWTFTSLDPMTMEATDDLMQGILPVNYNGTSGIGEVMFEVGVKPNKADGTQIPNRAGIVFDYEASILTPTWVNIVDATAPESHVADVRMLNDSTATVRIEAMDELSGPWRYNVYVQYGSGAWFLGAENVPADTTASVRVYEGIDHGFYVLATDSAGNVEAKEAVREFSFEVFAPQVDTSTKLQLAQGWNWVSHNQQEALSAEALKPGARRIVSLTDELYKDDRFGWTGTLSELLPTELYKVQMAEGAEVQLSGRLFNAAFRNIPLYAGWNWMGYPVAHTMTPAEALQKMEAEEGDFIVGQDGMATFTGGQWTGTLLTMEPGLGYMYRSVSDKSLFLNATAQSSSRMVHRSRFMAPGSEMPEGWTVNKRKYPNVMGMVCDLYQEGTLADHDEWLVGAFCGDECRGLSQTAGGHLMMNIYGQGGEEIVFLALHRGSGEVVDVIEVESFRSDVLGTLQQPYELHSGTLTGIAQMEGGKLTGEDYVYDLQGRRVKKSSLFNSQSSMQSKGVYIMSDGKKSRTRKVVRK